MTIIFKWENRASAWHHLDPSDLSATEFFMREVSSY